MITGSPLETTHSVDPDDSPVKHQSRLMFGNAHPLVIPNYFERKRIVMQIVGAALLVCFAPLILLTMLLVRLTSRGPALIWQTRLGCGGRQFEVVKIRTMYYDAEDVSGPILCQPGDSRITPVGRFLRFVHMDELPQLWNVARGEMCLVGPRPERPEIIARHKLPERVPNFHDRTRVLPGVTGLAQINLPADQSAECVILKVQLDREYIATASANLDMRILLCTALRMLGVRHGRALRLLRVGRTPSGDFSHLSKSGAAPTPLFAGFPPHVSGSRAAKPSSVRAYGRPKSGVLRSPAINGHLDQDTTLETTGNGSSDRHSVPNRPR